MKITHKKFLKYFYISVITLWILISIHLFYKYIEFSSDKKAIKGGTFVEAGLENITYLPYISNNSKDKFFQSLLFNGCLEPYVSGTKINYKNKLCNIENNNDNYKTFYIDVKENKTWSNGDKVTIDDIFFTYKNILKENKWNISYLNKYKDIEINKTKNNRLKIVFPYSSVDNMIFFTNFILNKNSVEKLSINQYIDKYKKEPTTTDCGKISKNIKDPNSIVFDLSNCNKNFLNSYQYKNFENISSLENYIKNSKNNIIGSYIHSKNISGFKENKIILNKFIGLFFNNEKQNVDSKFRKSFTNFIEKNFFSSGTQNYLIKDQFLFNSDISGNELNKLLKNRQNKLSNPKEVTVNIPNLENNIYITGNSITGNSYYLDEINENRFELNLNLENSAQRVSISHNNGQEYFLSLYQSGSKNATYNISPNFQNIQQGKNIYTIKGYKNGNSVFTKTFAIHYNEKPTKTIPASNKKVSFKVIYKGNPTNNFIVNKIKETTSKKGIENFFSFKKFEDTNEFEGNLQSKNYDIAIRGINMGLKKDISNIFKTSKPTINPSLYQNSELASLVNQYFLSNEGTRKNIKNEIDNIYSNDVPFYIFGKKYGNINIDKELNFSYPERLYDYRFRKDHLQNIKIKQGLKINKQKLLNTKNFIEFIKSNL